VTDRASCDDLHLDAIGEAVRAGVRVVQLRDRTADGRLLFDTAERLRQITNAQSAHLLINDRVDVALAAAADGAHCPEHGFPVKAARALLGPDRWIGASAHSVEAARRAARDGADFVFFGPIFHTPSKARFGAPLGLDALREAATAADAPVFAIGGVTPENAGRCMDHGAAGVAAISALLRAHDVRAAVATFEKVLGPL
jgi:thiamine-phosphate pyrophosphorylase